MLFMLEISLKGGKGKARWGIIMQTCWMSPVQGGKRVNISDDLSECNFYTAVVGWLSSHVFAMKNV